MDSPKNLSKAPNSEIQELSKGEGYGDTVTRETAVENAQGP